jgi:repressor LexA
LIVRTAFGNTPGRSDRWKKDPSMSHPLSKKQLEVLKALDGFARSRGHIPSVRELAGRLRKSPTTVFQHLKALERRGYVRGDGSAHGWMLLQPVQSAQAAGSGIAGASPGPRLVSTTSSASSSGAAVQAEREPVDLVDAPEVPEGWVRVRIAGTIAAGAPIEAVEDVTETRAFPADMVPSGAFALRVRGDSMIEDHICDGDLVIVRPQQQVDDGEIAVALLEDGSATLKRVFREHGRVRLQPANAAMQPIYADSVQIQGRVVGVWRCCSN